MPEKCIKDYVASAEASVAHQPQNQTKLTKMKSMIVVALALVAVVAAAPVEEPEQIVRSNYDQQPEGSYNFDFETAKGIVRQEEGTVKEALDEENKPHNVVVVRGSYSYPGEDGKPVSITYFADETGFHAEGDSIPKPARR